LTFLAPAFWLILALSILVLVHEWGHYIVARKAGVRVLKFSIGFGPEIVGVTRGDTRWSISAIPFGGYVRFAGDNPEESRDNASDEFLSKGVGARSAIVLAGPAMNYVLAVLLFSLVLYISGDPVPHSTRIGEVVEDSVAESVGIRAGDVVRRVNGTAVDTWNAFTEELYRVGPQETYRFVVERDGQEMEIAGTAGEKGFGTGSPLGVIYHQDAVLGYVKRNGPAWNAGLRTGDRVISFDGRESARWGDLVRYASDRPGQPVRLVWERDGARLEGTVTPAPMEMAGQGGGRETVGSLDAQARVETRRLGPGEALAAGAGEAWHLTRRVLELVPQLPALVVDGLGRLVTGREAQEEGLGGPLRMAEMFGEAARWGAVAFLVMMANISTQLAIFNLLPIPVLDGGHLALHLVEFVTRRPPSLKVRIVLQQIGFALLVLLMLSVTVMDVGRALG
jgi:regulator of sigma E protease